MEDGKKGYDRLTVDINSNSHKESIHESPVKDKYGSPVASTKKVAKNKVCMLLGK